MTSEYGSKSPRKSPYTTDWHEDIEDFVHECEVCGTQMYGLHCKIVCPKCGYKRDCSDP